MTPDKTVTLYTRLEVLQAQSNELMREEVISLKKYREDHKLIEAGLYQEPEDQQSELYGVFISYES